MDGIIIIDKPQGYTSQDVVSKVKKILNIKKAGHIGTLDPLATGVFPVLLGNATKVSKYLMDHDKSYIAKIRLGEKRSTGDLEGEVIEKSEKRISDKKFVEETLKNFEGKQIQTPPIYSAIKVNGKKLYQYARSGETVEIPKREIKICEIKLLNFDEEAQEIEFEVNCSKGTYIRTLCEDISERLGTVGFMSYLNRTKVGNFEIKNAITLNDLNQKSKIIAIEDVFKNLSKIYLDDEQEKLFLNGVKLKFIQKNGVYNIYLKNQKYIGLGVISNNYLKRDVVL